MKRTEQFINEIDLIKKKLNSLENKFIESYEDYLGNEFDGQNRCATEIENLTLMLTHELSTQIGFGIYDLKILLKYFDYRKTYSDYTDKELLNLIDKNDELNIVQRKEITEGKKEKNMSKIISNWNKTFENSWL